MNDLSEIHTATKTIHTYSCEKEKVSRYFINPVVDPM